MANTHHNYHNHLAWVLIYLLLWSLYQAFLVLGIKLVIRFDLSDNPLAKFRKAFIGEMMVTNKHVIIG